ncbi:PilT protein-like [Candidatus Vecturithrix granuli]|uniref:PilT protein-like n=1 Tax=Vecturithrix granuli TaxID=1499967 RepID=A0A081C2T2_VECG1|nr:PilT protein-like [Candidatus Vecturithrix granuli]
MLIDSNVLIYAADPNYAFLRELIKDHAPVVSIVSYIEVLGYEKLSDEQRQYFEEFFDTTIVLPVNEEIAKQAIVLRRQRKISLGDAIIAATAILYHHTLVTRNVEDFKWIVELKLLNPFE